MYDSTLWPAPSADVYLDRAEKIEWESKKKFKIYSDHRKVAKREEIDYLLHVELPT